MFSIMRLLIDEMEIIWDPASLRTFGDVIEEMARRASSSGRIIHGIEVNGEEVSIDEEREMSARCVDEIDSIHVRTTTSGELIEEAIEGAVCLSEALRHDIRIVVGFIRENDAVGAKDLCISCIESIGTFFHLAGAVFNGVRMGAFSLPASASGERVELPAPPAEFPGILKRFIDVWQAKDWLQMASILENEISPHIEEWAEFFSAMKDKAR